MPEIHLQFHILIYFGGCTFLSASILQFYGVKTWCGPLDKGLESVSRAFFDKRWYEQKVEVGLKTTIMTGEEREWKDQEL